MPVSVPSGLALELSRARLLDGREASFDAWMETLHERYDECLATLPGEQMASLLTRWRKKMALPEHCRSGYRPLQELLGLTVSLPMTSRLTTDLLVPSRNG